MKVSEAMTADVRVASPEDTLEQAAQQMAELDAGVLPVGEEGKLVGMLTDRDIAVRGVARGKGPQTAIREVMTQDVKYCFDDDDLDDVTRNMGDLQVRRLPVVDHDKRLVGIVSLGDIAQRQGDEEVTGAALGEISRPGGERSQSQGGGARP